MRDGRTFMLSAAGVAALLTGPVVIAVGHWMYRRAANAARGDPVTATVLIEAPDDD